MAGGNQATATATINPAGIITAITLGAGIGAGTGYTAPPTITIAAPPAGGTQAVARAIMRNPITAVTITNAGRGYTANS